MQIDTQYHEKIANDLIDESSDIKTMALKYFGHRVLVANHARFIKESDAKLLPLENETGEEFIDYVDAYHVIRIFFVSKADNIYGFELNSRTFFMKDKNTWCELFGEHEKPLYTRSSKDKIINLILEESSVEKSAFTLLELASFNLLYIELIELYDYILSVSNTESYNTVSYTSEFIDRLECDGMVLSDDISNVISKLKFGNINLFKLHELTVKIQGLEFKVYPVNEFGDLAIEHEEKTHIFGVDTARLYFENVIKSNITSTSFTDTIDKLVLSTESKILPILDYLDSNTIMYAYEKCRLTEFSKMLSTEDKISALPNNTISKFHLLNITHNRNNIILFFDIDTENYILSNGTVTNDANIVILNIATELSI